MQRFCVSDVDVILRMAGRDGPGHGAWTAERALAVAWLIVGVAVPVVSCSDPRMRSSLTAKSSIALYGAILLMEFAAILTCGILYLIIPTS